MSIMYDASKFINDIIETNNKRAVYLLRLWFINKDALAIRPWNILNIFKNAIPVFSISKKEIITIIPFQAWEMSAGLSSICEDTEIAIYKKIQNEGLDK